MKELRGIFFFLALSYYLDLVGLNAFDLVNQFDLMVAQFDLPSIPKREIVYI